MPGLSAKVSDRFLVWLVAILASGEAMAAAIQWYVDGRLDHTILWAAAAAAMVASAYIVKEIKNRRAA